MKKLFITIVAIFMPMLAMGQILYMNDFTGITEFTGWSQFDDSQTDGRVEVDPDGVAITVGIQTGQLWQPRIMVVPDGSFNLEAGSKYTVVVTAKFPTSGTLQINMGTWSYNDQANFPIVDTGDFQEVVCEFPDWTVNAEGAHLLFQCGDFKGTTILKKIEIWKGESLHTGKWTVAGDKDLLNANWDITYNSNIMYTSDNEKYSLTKTNLMLPKGTYEFKVFNNSETQESYPNSNATLVIEEDAVYTVIFTFNANTKEVSATATKTDGIFYNYIEKAKIAEVIQNPNKYKGDITIPEKVTHNGVEYSVTKISEKAFYSCDYLTSVEIPNGVISIGNNAFSWSSRLKSVTIPNSVTLIGSEAFYNCSALTSVTIPNNLTDIGASAFAGCSSLTSLTIPNSVITIDNGAFYNCSGLTSFTIPNKLSSISGYAFYGCSGLASITIPNNVTSIGHNAFYGCSGLTSFTIPNSVNYIYESAFSGCSGLKSVTIGSGISRIDENAFANCTKLEDVYCMAELLYSNENYEGLQTANGAFDGSYVDYATLHVPTSAINAYKITTPWSGFGEIVAASGEEMPKCAKPTISFENGKIKFSCETEGVEYVSEISTDDTGDKYTNEITLTGKITVKVYATKAGCLNSDIATAEFSATGVFGDINGDGKVNVADHVKLLSIIMDQNE